jgi:hypothetical protein
LLFNFITVSVVDPVIVCIFYTHIRFMKGMCRGRHMNMMFIPVVRSRSSKAITR